VGKRIVVKFGSGILATQRGVGLDQKQFSRLTKEVATLTKAGHQVIVVSSGAVAAGLAGLGLKARPEELAARQACAAVGQGRLMACYTGHFEKHGLLAGNVVPIINENDTVAVEELKFGDNDRLSAEVALLADAELLILLTSVEGLLDEKGRLIPRVDDFEEVAKFVRDEKGRLSVGGMASKLHAVQIAVNAGVPTVIASGRASGPMLRAAQGKPAGTYFPPPAGK
jgi:glutamate 5-kinase